jgi:hypothetical protein
MERCVVEVSRTPPAPQFTSAAGANVVLVVCHGNLLGNNDIVRAAIAAIDHVRRATYAAIGSMFITSLTLRRRGNPSGLHLALFHGSTRQTQRHSNKCNYGNTAYVRGDSRILPAYAHERFACVIPLYELRATLRAHRKAKQSNLLGSVLWSGPMRCTDGSTWCARRLPRYHPATRQTRAAIGR